MNLTNLTERQQRELDYHKGRAKEHLEIINKEIDFDLISGKGQRWWNHYWHMYTMLVDMSLRGKSVLIDGCGFGFDAINLAHCGANVSANDLSPESIDIATRRAEFLNIKIQNFSVAPCESLPYQDNSFDILVFFDILHHVDIPKAMEEAKRVLRPGGTLIIGEPYTHSVVQRIVRQNIIVEKFIYPLMRKFIYQTRGTPYITEDERKLNQTELDFIQTYMKVKTIDYFYFLLGRLFPNRYVGLAKLDRIFCNTVGSLGRVFSGRFLMVGTINK